MLPTGEYRYHRALYRNDVSLPSYSTVQTTAYYVGVFSESGFSISFEAERELCTYDAAAFPADKAACRIDTVLCM